MSFKIIDIGNSKGIGPPKVILQQLGIENEVGRETAKDSLILKANRNSFFERAKAAPIHCLMVTHQPLGIMRSGNGRKEIRGISC